MNRHIPTTILLAVAALLSLSPVIQADSLDVQLVQSDLTGAPGTTVEFFATITNPSTTDTIYLNGDSSSTSTPLLTVDDAPFFSNAPLFLIPGASSGPFELFDVIIDPSTPANTYTGNVFSILGGADGGAGTAFDDLADASFAVTVQTPEPTTFWLVLAISITLGIARWRVTRSEG